MKTWEVVDKWYRCKQSYWLLIIQELKE
jgi:hypothetical protein